MIIWSYDLFHIKSYYQYCTAVLKLFSPTQYINEMNKYEIYI